MGDGLTRKIVHVDMDCFYAAIEIRDNPKLVNKPVAVGGNAESRGVICTANYIARRYGVRSAMATAHAFRLCRDLILLPVDMDKYKAVARRIQRIFTDFTDLVEPLSLDEAYLDVSGSPHYQGSATRIALEIKKRIASQENLTASAGVASNKLLAKIASGWLKPDGLFVIKPEDVSAFMGSLPVNELYGVGKVLGDRMHALGLKTCADLQALSLSELTQHFGNRMGPDLYNQCRGQDYRPVMSHRERKSLSVEHTFPQDITDLDVCQGALKILHEKLQTRLQMQTDCQPIKNQFIKIKYSNFRIVTCETVSTVLQWEIFQHLLHQTYPKVKQPVRLLGVGVHFVDRDGEQPLQQSLF